MSTHVERLLDAAAIKGEILIHAALKIPIIDAHVHIMTTERIAGGMRWLNRNRDQLEDVFVDLEMGTDEARETLLACGVEYYFNFFYPIFEGTTEEVNRWNYELSLRDKKAIPFASLLPQDSDKPRIVDQALDEYNCLGFKLHPYVQRFSVKDLMWYEFFGYLQERQRPVVIHSGYENVYKTQHNREEIAWVLKNYPNLTVIIPHLCYPELDAAFSLLEEFPQVYLDATNVFWSLKADHVKPHWWDKFEAHSKRMIFGTDFTMGMNSPQRLFDQFTQLPLSEGAKADLLYRTAWNMAKRFGRELAIDSGSDNS